MNLDTPILFAATTDSKRARKFYEEALGLEFVADDPFALVFRVGRLQLRLQKVDRKPKITYTVLGWAVSDIRKTVRQFRQPGWSSYGTRALTRTPTASGGSRAARRWPGFETPTTIRCRSLNIRDDLGAA